MMGVGAVDIAAWAARFTRTGQQATDATGVKVEQAQRRQTLHRPHDLRHTVSRYRLHEQMDVVLVRPNFQILQLVAFRNLKTSFKTSSTCPLSK